MPSIWEFLPAELRERLEEAPDPFSVALHRLSGVRPGGKPVRLTEDERSQREEAWQAESERLQIAHDAAVNAANEWFAGALLSGNIRAIYDCPRTGKREYVPAARWGRLRLNGPKDGAIVKATGVQAISGLDFERPAEPQPQPEPGTMAVASAITPELLARALRDEGFAQVSRERLRGLCKRLSLDASDVAIEAAQKATFGTQRPGPKRKSSA